jgi:hypothetical protein
MMNMKQANNRQLLLPLVPDFRVHDWSGDFIPLSVLAWGVCIDLFAWQREAEFVNWCRQPKRTELWLS